MQGGTSTGFLDAASKIFAENGTLGFWAGSRSTLWMATNPAVTYVIYERLQRWFSDRNRKRAKARTAHAAAAAAAGTEAVAEVDTEVDTAEATAEAHRQEADAVTHGSGAANATTCIARYNLVVTDSDGGSSTGGGVNSTATATAGAFAVRQSAATGSQNLLAGFIAKAIATVYTFPVQKTQAMVRMDAGCFVYTCRRLIDLSLIAGTEWLQRPMGCNH